MNQTHIEGSTLTEAQALNYERGLQELQNSLARISDAVLKEVINSLYLALSFEEMPTTREHLLLHVIHRVPLEDQESIRLALWKALDVTTSDTLQQNPIGSRMIIGKDFSVQKRSLLERLRACGIPVIGSDADIFQRYRDFVL